MSTPTPNSALTNSETPSPTPSDASPNPTEQPATGPRQKGAALRQFLTAKWRLVAPIAIVAVLLVGGGASAYFYHVATTKPASKSSTSSSTKTDITSSAKDTTPTPTGSTGSTTDTSDVPFTAIKTISGVTLFDKGVLLGNLHFFANYIHFFSSSCTDDSCTKQVPNVSDKDVTYYQIGATSSGQRVINVSVKDDGNGPTGLNFNFVAIETTSDHYTIYAVTSRIRKSDASDLKLTFNPKVTLDTTTGITELTFPDTMTVISDASQANSAVLTIDSATYGFQFEPTGHVTLPSFYGNVVAPATVFGSNGNRIAYELNLSKDSSYKALLWQVNIHNLFSAEYTFADPLSAVGYSPNQVAITWSDTTSNEASYMSQVGGGCGFIGSYSTMPASFNAGTLVKAGTTAHGAVVYELANSDSLLQSLYADYKNASGDLSTTSLKNLSLNQFQAAHALVIAQNSAGEYTVYLRGDMFDRGGCGKPVVYLYPQAPTNVSIQVGAEVVKSDPLYNAASGWQNVLAQPDGQLTYQGRSYPSLYWEGYGYGVYPAINSGTVVPSFLARVTIEQQLQAQGLHQNEIDDFLAYWTSKLPTTPYTRLTWLTTAQMNVLAPLNISPRPDTLIRVFLDFEGVEQPEALTPQHFVAPARNGFTVVEWGGLLRGGIR